MLLLAFIKNDFELVVPLHFRVVVFLVLFYQLLQNALGDDSMGNASTIKIDRSKKTSQILSDHGSGKVFDHLDFLWQGLNSIFVDEMTQEGDFRFPEFTFGGVDFEIVLPETLENLSQVVQVLLVVPRGDSDVVNIFEAKWKACQNLVDVPLEGLAGISETELHNREFEQSKWSDYRGFLDVIGMNWDLMVGSGEIDFGKYLAAFQINSRVLNVWNRVAIRNCLSIKSPVIATRSPIAIFLGDEMKWARPWGL